MNIEELRETLNDISECEEKKLSYFLENDASEFVYQIARLNDRRLEMEEKELVNFRGVFGGLCDLDGLSIRGDFG